MKGFFAVDIPTKKYIAAYLHHQLGPKPIFSLNNKFGDKMYELLLSKRNERKVEFSNARYNTVFRFYINARAFRRRGSNLNETNIIAFNRYVEKEIKHHFYFLMDTYIEMLPNFSANLPSCRQNLGIDIEAWDDDSMKKDYYRYRIATGKPLLYFRKNYLNSTTGF